MPYPKHLGPSLDFSQLCNMQSYIAKYPMSEIQLYTWDLFMLHVHVIHIAEGAVVQCFECAFVLSLPFTPGHVWNFPLVSPCGCSKHFGFWKNLDF